MADLAPTRCVFLIGFMGAGKTTVGQALARRWHWTFQDLDQIIEHRRGKSVAAIFAEAGEAEFRRLESSALNQLLALSMQNDAGRGHRIVAVGGGAFVQPANRQAIQQAGAITVLLEAPLEELRRRCRQDTNVRPLALDEARFAQLFAERQAAYSLAQFRVDTMNKAVDEVAAEIERLLSAVVKPEVTE
jgi:shikimate kinase